MRYLYLFFCGIMFLVIIMKYDLYDFDGTIYDGDSGVDFSLFAIKKYPKIIRRLPGMFIKVLAYLFKLCSKEEMKSKVFSYFQDIDDMDKFVEDFWKTHEHKLKDFWTSKKSHKNDIIISASCTFWLKPVADKYKVADLFGTDIDIKTGEIKGDNCHGKNKVKMFYDKYPKAKIETMYTDSINDLPLIEEAKEGFLVKGKKIYNYYEYKPNFIVRFWRWGWGIYHKNEEVWNYLIVGGLTTVVNLVTKWVLWAIVLYPKNALQLQISIIISWITAVLFAYITNRIYVFKSKSKQILKEMSSFFGARLLTLGMEMLIMWFFVTFLRMDTKMWSMIWTIVTQVLIVIFNYIFSKLFVFKKKD